MMISFVKRLKALKYPISVIVFGFVLLIFILSTNPVQRFQKSTSLWKTQYVRQEVDEELWKVLKNASMPDNKTVILTTLNEAWADPGSVMDLFLESFRIGKGTPKLLNHLVIVAMDQQAFNRCKSIHPHCYFLTTTGVNFTAEKRFMTPDYLKLMWRRIDFLRTVLELGYNFVFTDADIMWFRDPFPYFDSLGDIQIACDYYKGNPIDKKNKANGGFNYVKSSEATIKFYKYWYKARITHPNLHDQAVFEIIKHERIVSASLLKIKYLDTMYFGGFCQPSMDMNKVCTMHANCCVGIEKKINDLRLILDDWEKFTSLPPEQKKPISGNSSPWSAPSKCKKW